MKKLFLYLLKRYSKTEEGRLQILSELDKGIYYTYFEQTPFGNVYNYFIEFVLANKFIIKQVKEDNKGNLEILKRGIDTAFDDSVKFIKNEN